MSEDRELLAAEIADRLEDLLSGNDQFHPVGCSEWEDRARVAIDMAKDFIRQQAAISDASQPGTDDAPCVGSAPSLPTEDAAGGWIVAPEGGWRRNPAPGAVCEYRSGSGGQWSPGASDDMVWPWENDGGSGDIIAYRIAAPTTPASPDDQIPPRDGEKA